MRSIMCMCAAAHRTEGGNDVTDVGGWSKSIECIRVIIAYKIYYRKI